MIDIDALTEVSEPAERLLFRALQPDRDALVRADREAWRGLCEVALRTFSAPLVHATLARHGLLDVAPDEVVVRLARVRAWNAGRWEVASGQVESIAQALASQGVRCIA
jgi:hypothetical protein